MSIVEVETSLLLLTFLSTFLAAPQHVRAQSDAIDGGGWHDALSTRMVYLILVDNTINSASWQYLSREFLVNGCRLCEPLAHTCTHLESFGSKITQTARKLDKHTLEGSSIDSMISMVNFAARMPTFESPSISSAGMHSVPARHLAGKQSRLGLCV